MSFCGSIVGAVMLKKDWKQKIVSFFVGIILALCLADPASSFFGNGDYAGVFGFFIGFSGMTIAKILLKAFEKHSKTKLGITEEDLEEGN